MKNSTKALMYGAAISGLMAGTTPILHASTTTAVRSATVSVGVLSAMGTKDKHACKGQNSCKGKGGCKSSDNGCKGKNSCKGKGGCATDGSKPPA
ncbi:MAG: hypothetical protein ABI147_08985 [Acidobacteriaceae bacterium]